jgi:hypothetical protein
LLILKRQQKRKFSSLNVEEVEGEESEVESEAHPTENDTSTNSVEDKVEGFADELEQQEINLNMDDNNYSGSSNSLACLREVISSLENEDETVSSTQVWDSVFAYKKIHEFKTVLCMPKEKYMTVKYMYRKITRSMLFTI